MDRLMAEKIFCENDCTVDDWSTFQQYMAVLNAYSSTGRPTNTDLVFSNGWCKKIFSHHALRLCSFHIKHNHIFKKVSCVQLALAGYYNTLTIGEIKCFSCDFSINLSHLQVDPVMAHQSRRNCLHVRGLDKRNVPFGIFSVEGILKNSSQLEPLATDNDDSITEQSDSDLYIGDDSVTCANEVTRNTISLQRLTESNQGNMSNLGSFLNNLSNTNPLHRTTPSELGSFLNSSSRTDVPERPDQLPNELTNDTQQPTRPSETANSRYKNINRKVPITDYRYELCRFQSFSKWPSNAAVPPEELANAGFFYLGNDDGVQCHFCQGKLRNWEPEDRPLGEHIRHFPQCPYLAGPEFVGNVPLGEEDEALFRSVFMREGASQANTNEMPGLIAKGIVSDRPIYPDKVQMTQRLATFRDYPSNTYHKPEDLVKAGFFYTGLVDEVRCYFCNVSIKNWKPSEDPLVQHALRSPKCGFLTMSKGQDFITKAKAQRHQLKIKSKASASQGTLRKVSEDRLQEVMSSRIVVSVLDMDLEESLVKKVVLQRLKEVGEEFPNSESLIDSVAEYEEVESDESDTDEENAVTTSPKTTERNSLQMLKVRDESTTSNEDASVLEETNQQLREDNRCKVCLDGEACIVFLKCGHLVCCSRCAPELVKCPVCRENILGTIRVDKDGAM